MSTEHTFERLRNANPVPDPVALAERSNRSVATLATATERRAEMLTDETRTESLTTDPNPLTAPTPPKRGWLVAAATAAVVIAVGIAGLALTRGSAGDVANPTTAEEIALALTDLESGVAAEDFLSPDVTVFVAGIIDGGYDEWFVMIDWLGALGAEHSNISCTEGLGGPPTYICTLDRTFAASRALDLDPYEDVVFAFEIENGIVLAFQEIQSGDSREATEVIAPFGAWVAENRPNEATSLSGGPDDAWLTAEVVPAWESLMSEYVAAIEAGDIP